MGRLQHGLTLATSRLFFKVETSDGSQRSASVARTAMTADRKTQQVPQNPCDHNS